MVPGCFKCITFIVHFSSIIIIASASPRIVRHYILEVGDPCFKSREFSLSVASGECGDIENMRSVCYTIGKGHKAIKHGWQEENGDFSLKSTKTAFCQQPE